MLEFVTIYFVGFIGGLVYYISFLIRRKFYKDYKLKFKAKY